MSHVDTADFHLLSLCSGVGMLDEGVSLALERAGQRAVPVGYVERESSAAAMLLARMEEQSLEPAPIWCGNLEEFPARQFHGMVDGLVAGFPCPPVSAAGKRRGKHDERWILPVILRIAGETGARWLFLENVFGLLSANDGDAFGEVVRSQAAHS